MHITLLALESSCDETAAAVCRDGQILSNVISSQLEHSRYGGVIPELASRLHQQQIVYVVQEALAQAGLRPEDLSAIAVTQGPGLMGALMVGMSFAKAYAWSLGIPFVAVNHMQAHVMANFISAPRPEYPFLCLTVSGGHTQLVLAHSPLQLEVIGASLDDAAGEAFDKAAKIMGLPYPGGPEIDRLARLGDAQRFVFPKPQVAELAFSFSGLKTSLLYLLKRETAQQPDFIAQHLADLCASYQRHIVDILLEKLHKAARRTGATQLALAGGVSANRELRERFEAMCRQEGWQAFVPAFEYCTDNAAMIALAGYERLKLGLTSPLDSTPFARDAHV